MKRLLLVLIITVYSVNAQVETSGGVQASSGVQFYIDTAEFLSSDSSKTRLDIFVQVPYSSIQFLKRGNTFNASYNITLTFFDKDKKNILFERMWKERLSTEHFDQTISRNNSNLSYRTFDLEPNNYIIRCVVEDADSRKSSSREFPIELRAINDRLDISGVILISEIIKDSTGERMFPNVSNIVTNKLNSLQIYNEVYSENDAQVFIEYFVENLKSNVTTKQLLPKNIKAGTNQINYTLENVNFQLGDYIIRVVLKNNEWEEVSSTEKRFYSKIYGLPNTILDLDKAIDQMIYIASNSELSYIKKGETYDEKLNRFLAFWNSKKPNTMVEDNPILYEYYRRIDYANKNFKGISEGWKSDMAMIYVTFGPPSYVERHPFDANSRPYEVWDYYELNRSFVFIDQTGFGDYRLYNPDYSRWPGYRQ